MIQFKTRSRLSRSLSAAAAVLSTVLMLSGVVGLALHYEKSATTPSVALAPTGTSATTSV